MITEEDYVSFETAKLLKEKGFDWECKTVKFFPEPDYDAESPNGVYAPTLQMVMKWLREVHNYVIQIDLDSYVNESWNNQYYIVIRRRKVNFEEVSPCEQVFFDTYESACEAAIKYCLENLI